MKIPSLTARNCGFAVSYINRYNREELHEENNKKLAAAGCALILIASSAVVSNRLTLNGIKPEPPRREPLKLVVSGQEFTSDNAGENIPGPYAQDGSVYLPLQLVGEVIGKSVDFDSSTRTVYIGKAPLEEDALQTALAYLENPD